MTKQSKSSKTKQYVSLAMLIFTIAFFVTVFGMKDTMQTYLSNTIKKHSPTKEIDSTKLYIDSTFNYSRNKLKYEITFLEFGATSCIACRKMETVMEEVKQKYPSKVNVFFLNILEPETQMLMKYYGIVAIPTQVLLNKQGTEFFRHTGYLSTDDLIKNLSFQTKLTNSKKQ